MQRTTVLTATATATVCLAGTAWFANAQLGPLDPPDGPVEDTGPSLAELLALAASNHPEDNRITTVHGTGNGQVFTISESDIVLQRVQVFTGSFRIDDADDVRFFTPSGVEANTGNANRNEPFQYELGIRLNGPVTATGTDSLIGSGANFIFREVSE